jgi:hypothetical protein
MELHAANDVVYVVEPGVLDASAVAAFTLGQCHGIALAVHELTSWPLVGVYDSDGRCQHILVDAGDDRLVDIAGARGAAELLSSSDAARLEVIDRREIDRLVTDEGWASPDTSSASEWRDQVIERGASCDAAMAMRPLGLTVSVDDDLELVFRWGATEYVDVLLRRPGEPEAAWLEWLCFRVPRSTDGLRRVRFTDEGFEDLVDLWLGQRFDPDAARASLRAAYGGSADGR